MRRLGATFCYLLLTSFLITGKASGLNITSNPGSVYELTNDRVTEEDSSLGEVTDDPLLFHSHFAYRKCYCDIQEVWTGDECMKIDTQTIVSLLSNIQDTSENFLNFVLAQVDIESNIACPEPNQLITIEDDSIYLLENGDLYLEQSEQVFLQNNYCFEFKLHENLQIISTVIKVCLTPPKVPFCCERFDCSAEKIETVLADFGGTAVQWSQYSLKKTEIPVCKEPLQLVNWAFNKPRQQISFFHNNDTLQMVVAPPPPADKPQVVSSSEFCLKKGKENTINVSFCYSDPVAEHEQQCQNSVCVRKCCPPDEIYDLAQRTCSEQTNRTSLYTPQFYSINNTDMALVPKNLTMEYAFPWCSPQTPYLLDPAANSADDFHLLPNGSLFIVLSALAMPPTKYCVDNFLDPKGLASTKAITCFLDTAEKKDYCKEVHRILYPILIVISCIFLAVTLTVYASLAELRAKLHGKCLLSHVSSLLIAYLCQLIVSWSSTSLTMTGCRILALGNQVSFLWAFFWLNVMCFDIWWTLKTMSPSPETGDSSRRRFVLYSIYAWGCPLIISFVTGVFEFLPKSLRKSRLILPGFGIRGCWFQDVRSTWIYFYGFTLLLYVMNILYFFHVAAILIRGQRSTEGILRKTRKQQRERVYLYLKLFIVMGITWICEVASWQEGTCIYWIFTDIVNSLQGVFIFFIFMCNKKVYQKIHANGAPIFVRMKTLVRTPSSMASNEARNSSQRTTQTSVESSKSSLRRLSNSLPT